MQARGENLISVLKAFTASPNLKVASERKSLDVDADVDMVERAVLFDYLTRFMVGAFDSHSSFFFHSLFTVVSWQADVMIYQVYYPKRVAMVLHNVPSALFLVAPFFLYMRDSRTHPFLSVFWAFLKGNNVQFFYFLNLFIIMFWRSNHFKWLSD